MSLSKSKRLYSNNSLHFLKGAGPLGSSLIVSLYPRWPRQVRKEILHHDIATNLYLIGMWSLQTFLPTHLTLKW
jgi:hypothetical protein